MEKHYRSLYGADAEKRFLDKVMWKVEKGVNLNVSVAGFDVDLIEAMVCGFEEVVDYLLEKGGADPNFCDIIRGSPIYVASDLQCKVFVEKLIARGGKVNYQYPSNCVECGGWTALHQVIRNCRFDMADFLIENGADFTIKDGKGMTPFDHCWKQWRLRQDFVWRMNYAIEKMKAFGDDEMVEFFVAKKKEMLGSGKHRFDGGAFFFDPINNPSKKYDDPDMMMDYAF